MKSSAAIVALLSTCIAVAAQCALPTNLATNPPDFRATHYVGGPNPAPVPDPGFQSLWDMTVRGAVAIASIDAFLFDDGVNPDQVGNSGPCALWLCPTTYIGNAQNAAAWTQVGAGTITVADSTHRSTCVFATPVTLQPGSYGVALQIGLTTVAVGNRALGRLHPLVVLPSTLPLTPLVAEDQFLFIHNETTQRVAFASSLQSLHTINIDLHYTAAPGSAHSTPFGSGCYFRPHTFYEQFTAPASPFDLGNRSLAMTRVGDRYAVAPSGAGIVPPQSPPLVGVVMQSFFGDEDFSAPIALPFVFQAPGGVATNVIVIGSNGFVFLGDFASPFGTTHWAFRDLRDVLAAPARLAVAYGDWDPSTTGTIHCDIDASQQSVRVTWLGVAERNEPAGSLTAQVELFADGRVDYRYGACAQVAAPVLVGYLRSDGIDPGNRDLAVGGAIAPFLSGDGLLPPVLRVRARPVLGSTAVLETTSIAAGAAFSVLALSFGSIAAPGLDLAALGMPGCAQYVALPASASLGPVVGGVHTESLAIPNQAIWLGQQLFAQSAPLVPGHNAANVLTSNGLCLQLGN